ncbi:MAG: LysR family transcriptional regulator [Pseudomonadota bacterium]
MSRKPEPGNNDKLDLADISLRALQVFVAVEETGSMTLAATRIGLSRSGVSQHITNLENTLGVQLLDRAARPLKLTPVGHTLRHHAHRVLEVMSDARTELMEASLSTLTELCLGIIDDLDTSVTPELMTHLRTRFPRALLSVTSGRSDHLVAQLENRGADIILSGLLPDARIRHMDYPILREPFMIVAPSGLLDSDQDLRRQIQERPYIQYNTNMPMGQAISQQLRRLRIEPKSLAAFDSSRSVFAMLQKSGGWAITTPLCLLDSRADLGRLDCHRLPFAAFSRTIRMIARSEELGHLPANLAQLTRQLLTEKFEQEFTALPAWIGAETVILGDDGQPVRQAAASASAQA